jgi:hypothetical protein
MPDARDPTRMPVEDGTLTTWSAGERTFAVHSTGQWRSDSLRGELSTTARAMWAAVLIVAAESGDLTENADPEQASLVRLGVATPTQLETAYYEATRVPPGLIPIANLLAKWMRELDGWTPAKSIADLVNIRAT